MLANLFAARWLGHGRAVECFLALGATLQGVSLLPSGAALDSSATVAVAWAGYGDLLAYPILLYAGLAWGGLVGNIMGWRGSRWARLTGASMGCGIWAWYVSQFFFGGNFAAVGFNLGIPSVLFSVRIMGLALAGLPRPGAPGASGK